MTCKNDFKKYKSKQMNYHEKNLQLLKNSKGWKSVQKIVYEREVTMPQMIYNVYII